MRKIALMIMFAVVSNSAMAEWVEVSRNDIQTNYVDLATIHEEGGMVQMWVLYDYKTAVTTDGKSYYSTNAALEFDCKEGQYRQTFSADFPRIMGLGKYVNRSDVASEWKKVLHGSDMKTQFETACRSQSANSSSSNSNSLASDPTSECISQIKSKKELQILKGKIELGGAADQPIEILANSSVPTKKERAAISLWITEHKNCKQLGNEWRETNVLPSIIALLEGVYSDTYLLAADLYAKKISYGDYAKAYIKIQQEFKTNTNAEIQQLRQQQVARQDAENREREVLAQRERDRQERDRQRLAEQQQQFQYQQQQYQQQEYQRQRENRQFCENRLQQCLNRAGNNQMAIANCNMGNAGCTIGRLIGESLNQ